MLQTIISKEIRDIFTSTKFISSFAVCAFLIIVSFYAGASNYLTGVEKYEAAMAENNRQFEGLTEWYNVRENKIMMPPEPLAALVTGLSNDVGRLVDVSPTGELSAYGSRFNEEPMFAVFRFLDLEFIFAIVLSLFAILLGYDAISGEKEGGTLKLALSNQVPRSTYLLGKLIGSASALTVSLIAAIALGLIILPIMGVPMTGADWVRLLLIVGCGLLYFGVFLTLSLFVSALTHHTSSSFLTLLVIWIVAVTILPRASVLLAARAVEVPSVDEISYQKAAYATSLWGDFRDDLQSYKPDQSEDMEAMMSGFNSYLDSLSKYREAKMAEFGGRLNENRYNRQKIQQAVAFNIARISPTASLTLATSSLAGTSLGLEGRFRDEAHSYQKVFGDFLFDKTGMSMGGMIMIFESDEDGAEEKKEIDVSEIPVFSTTPPDLNEVIGEAIVDMGILSLYNLIFFAGAFVAFGRYDAR